MVARPVPSAAPDLPRLAGLLAFTLLAPILFAGSVGDPTPGGFIRFDDIRRQTFGAIAVQRAYGDDANVAPLLVRVNVLGDAADADISQATTWLAKHVNVRVVRDPAGAPLYLTYQNLIATSGPGALGATVRSGMAVEMIDDRMSPCVVAHEVLHFLGLHHVDSSSNLMYPRCGPNKLGSATLTAEQKAEVATLDGITAVTPGGVVRWASRV